MHPKISKFFWSNAGIWLMNVESEIAEYVLIACCNSGIDVLCIHDGFICKISDSNEVLRLMRRGFRAVTGYAGEVRVGVK